MKRTTPQEDVADTIAKSIECFLQALLAEAAVEANKRGGKKLTAYHLYV